jgi:hypothetical protein
LLEEATFIIYLDLATETEIAQLRFCALPDATRNFSVKVSKRPTVLACRSFCLFGVISFQSKPWKLTHALTNRKVQLLTVVLILFWKLKMVQGLIHATYIRNNPGAAVRRPANYRVDSGTRRRARVKSRQCTRGLISLTNASHRRLSKLDMSTDYRQARTELSGRLALR